MHKKTLAFHAVKGYNNGQKIKATRDTWETDYDLTPGMFWEHPDENV